MSAVLVLGNAGMDVSLTLARLVRPGETVVASSAHGAPGGKGLNQAVVAARAGARVRFRAPIGADAEAGVIEAALDLEPFAELALLRKALPTDQSIIMVADDGENAIVSLGGCADALTEREAAAFAASAEPGDWLLLQGNLSEAATLAAIRAARGPVVLNPAPLRWALEPMLPHCAWVVVNRHEAAAVTGSAEPGAAAAWLQARGCGVPVVTLGAEGCLWLEAGVTCRMASSPVRPVDTTGAGDTFCGALIAGLSTGIGPTDAIAWAQAAAAVTVTRIGAFAALPTVTELRSVQVARNRQAHAP